MMPRTARELQQLLEERNLYPWYAAANGSEPHEGWALIEEKDKWVVYQVAPLTARKERSFNTEHEAVAWLISEMKNDAFADYFRDLE